LRLSALRNFDSVAIHLEKGAQRGQVIVVIDVSENSPIAMEWVMGGSYRMETGSALVGGRIAHQNLFGEGKFADLTAVARVPLGGKGHSESYDLALRYADPLLFGSRRWYGIASAAWHKNDYEDQYGNFGRLETPQFDLAAGWRFADFSYLTSGISYRPGIELSTGYWLRDGTFETDNGDDLDFSFNLTYGWNSEDDLNFPTQGSTFAFGLSTNLRNVTGVWVGPIQFRKTWSWMDAYWTLKVGGDPNPEYHLTISENQLFAMTYARPVAAGDNVRRGRWYIEPGFGLPGFTNEGRQIYLAGLKAGYRADTRMFGIVDLYFIGTVDVNK
jgi:outer membrane protein assembly factor BamA